MHDINVQCSQYSLETSLDDDLQELSVAWLNRANVITTQQDRDSRAGSPWQAPLRENISRENQLQEIAYLKQSYTNVESRQQTDSPLARVIDIDHRTKVA